MRLALLLLLLVLVPPPAVTVHLVGDSTMADKPDPDANPERGWGQMLRTLVADSVVVRNHARNGRSTKSFRDEGLWAAALAEVRPGDLVFIQFGHNDAKEADSSRYTVPATSFRRNLVRFATEARSAGARPVLFTPIVRRHFNEAGTLTDTHGLYPLVVREVAQTLGVPLVDLQLLTEDLVREAGVEGSKALYVWTAPGEVAMYPDGRQDDTHLSVRGATAVATLALDALADQGVRLRRAEPARAGE